MNPNFHKNNGIEIVLTKQKIFEEKIPNITQNISDIRGSEQTQVS